MEFIKKNIGYLIALSGIGLFLYAFNLHGPLFWDDTDWILNNISLHSLTWANIKFIFSHDVLAGIGRVSNYYRPFLFLTFLANYLIGGSNPVGYHLISNGVHILNACLIFYLLTHWLSPVVQVRAGSGDSNTRTSTIWVNNKRVAFLASLLFLIHPLQTEAVAYISGRGDPLSVMFILLGLIFFIKSQSLIPNTKYLILSVGAAVLAILSRETAVLFPAYLGVALIAFEYKGLPSNTTSTSLRESQRQVDVDILGLIWERFKKAFINALPFIGISVVYGILRLTVLNFQNTLNFYQQQNIYSEHISYRIYTFFHVLVVYLRLIVWPTGLHMDRDIPVSLHIWDTGTWLGAFFIVAGIGWLVFLYRRETQEHEGVRGRYQVLRKDKKSHNTIPIIHTPSFNVWFFGLGIFFVNLLPTSGIVPINARIYEHWLYFSLFGFFTIVAFYLDKILSFLKNKNSIFYFLLTIFLIIYCLFLSIQTIRRNLLWADTGGLYKNILFYEPSDVRVLNNLGNWYSDHGNNPDAAPLYQRAIEADPTQPAPYYNLGNIARDSGDLVKAEEMYQKAISISPTFYYAYGNLAQIYFNEKRYTDALAMLERLQQIYPSDQNLQNISLIRNLIIK